MKRSLGIYLVLVSFVLLGSCSTLNQWRYSIFGGQLEMVLSESDINAKMSEIFPHDTLYYNYKMQLNEPRILSLDTSGHIQIIAQIEVEKTKSVGGNIIVSGNLKYEKQHKTFIIEDVELKDFILNDTIDDFNEKAVRIYAVIAFKRSALLDFNLEKYKIKKIEYQNNNSIKMTIE
jgi:hypothetical protein